MRQNLPIAGKVRICFTRWENVCLSCRKNRVKSNNTKLAETYNSHPLTLKKRAGSVRTSAEILIFRLNIYLLQIDEPKFRHFCFLKKMRRF